MSSDEMLRLRLAELAAVALSHQKINPKEMLDLLDGLIDRVCQKRGMAEVFVFSGGEA